MLLEKVHTIKFKVHNDDRGSLTVIQGLNDVPFDIKRIFYISDVPINIMRGGHAHIETDQVAIAINGSVRIIVNDGVAAKQITLNCPNQGLFLPRMTWSTLTDFSPGAVCMVLTNTAYEPSEYIRNWIDYLNVRALPVINEFSGSFYPEIP